MKYLILKILILAMVQTISCSGLDGSNGKNGKNGTSCDVEDDGAYLGIKCGEAEGVQWAKAVCGKTAYDPAVMECNYISNTLSFHFVDERDGKVYKALIAGSQTWMAENLSYVGNSDTLSRCYNDSITNCAQYGRLYDWETAKTVCPNGWHLPTNAEWDKLFRHADGDSSTYNPYDSYTAGKYLKTKNCNGTDEFGFAALPGGYYRIYTSSSYFGDVGSGGYWWTATENSVNNDNAHYRNMECSGESVYLSACSKMCLINVRCVMD
jgi:uncharacterized protein (TIGR02145 family)